MPQLDPEVAAALAALAPPSRTDPPPLGDVDTRRRNAVVMFERAGVALPTVNGVGLDHFTMRTGEGTMIPLAWYRPADRPGTGSAVLYLHGGGMILGLAHLGVLYDAALRSYVAASGVPMLAVDYRVAPEHPHPVPLDDCYSALQWLADHAGTLGVDPARVAVMGDSAGGGLAAAVTLLARDRGGPPIAAQLLVYPMLDDRTSEPDSTLAPLLTWSADDNRTGWAALLGESTPDGYAAAAHAADLSGLPPAYLDVGDLDLFLGQDIDYARRLIAAGVSTELHVHPGCPHAFEWLAPRAAVSRRVIAERVRRLRAL